MAQQAAAVSPDTLITIKISVNNSVKKLKLPLKDLGAEILPVKLNLLLATKPDQTFTFERFSDSAGGYITLDPQNAQVFKTLIRAAKAKLKLRLKATVNAPLEEPNYILSTTAEEKIPHKAAEPLIVHSPVCAYMPPGPTTSDRRSIGSGIFEFREARASQQTLVDTCEAPVPREFNAVDRTFFSNVSQQGAAYELAGGRTELPSAITVSHPYSIYCNDCDVAMTDNHYHCSICDGGDYDLCERCVADGKVCPGQGHWLIKRSIKDGKIVSSTTERVQPRKAILVLSESMNEKEVPGAFIAATKTVANEPHVLPTRTCNSCVAVHPDHGFVTCIDCEDFDLCYPCHTRNKHGHHPAHAFKPVTADTSISMAAEMLLAPGRNVCHNAICDGCDKKIYGVRHKCLNCPDWDYCNDCVKNARRTHPHHRFAALYEPIANASGTLVRHFGIYCDGPLCKNQTNQSYVTGVRYKCAVCHDTDFCASCEALPGNTHNRTHPLVKIKTPVRDLSITTQDDVPGSATRIMGDRRPNVAQAETKSASTETTPVEHANAATQMQSVPDTLPAVEHIEHAAVEAVKAQADLIAKSIVPATLLNAHFVADSIPDGQPMEAGTRFTQMWTMRNPGPYVWPAGCSVRFVGGDNMLNVDNVHPGATSDINEASESNVVGREIKVGEQVAFKVTLKVPMRPGRFISYWRTKSADGTPFGHRLWCDISVNKAADIVAVQRPVTSATPFITNDVAARARTQQRARPGMWQRDTVAGMPQVAHDAGVASANHSSRVAAMREQQAKRREQMMTQFNAHRDNLQARGINRNDMPGSNQYFSPAIGSAAEPTADDKARTEAARARVEYIKAKIMRAREDKSVSVKAEVAEKAATVIAAASDEKVKKIIEAVNKDAEKEAAEDVEGSQMIFPKLEKESPESSTYESGTSSTNKGKAAYVENEQGEVERSASPMATVSVPEVVSPVVEKDEDDFDDLEVLSALGDDSEDDGFLTDEEYDILDASDQETVASP